MKTIEVISFGFYTGNIRVKIRSLKNIKFRLIQIVYKHF